MNPLSNAAVLIAALFSLPATAGDAGNLNFTPRQMAHCVMHRVREARGESYKAAIKACKSQFDAAAANAMPTQTVMNAVPAGPVK